MSNSTFCKPDTLDLSNLSHESERVGSVIVKLSLRGTSVTLKRIVFIRVISFWLSWELSI